MNTIKVANNFNSEKVFIDLYRELSQLTDLTSMFYASDKPYLYKDILLYPITMELFMVFNVLANCLVLNKNMTGDIKAIQRTYLDYIFYLAENGRGEYALFLERLLLLVLHKNELAINADGDYILCENGNLVKTIEFVNKKGKFYIYILKDNIEKNFSGINEHNYHIFNSADFDNIRKIICQQNNVELLDEDIHPDKIKKIEEWEKMQSQKNADIICSIEEQKATMKVIKGWDTKQVDNMTIRSFYTELDRIGILLEYGISNILRPYMDKKDAKKITSWLGKHKKQSKLEQITRDYDEFNNKFSPQKINN